MKRFATIAALLFAAAILIGFTGCKKEPEITYYTVSFDTDGAGDIASQKVEDGKLATKPEDPSKTGYTFGGWYNGETAFDFATPITADTGLKAKWTANTYKVTLLVKGDTAEDDVSTEVTVTYGQKISDLEEVPEKTDFVFAGYYTAEDAEGDRYIDEDGKGCKEWDLTQGITLYAAFGYQIIYTDIEGLTNPNPKFYIPGKGLETLVPLSGKKGYDFYSWVEAGIGYVPEDEPVIASDATGSKTFYPYWYLTDYTINYNLPEDVYNPNSNHSEYTIEDEFTLSENLKSCYLFEGWYDAPTGGNKVTTIQKGTTGNINLYPRGLVLGTKDAPSEKYDIVFNNGRACSYIYGSTSLDTYAVSNAVAVIVNKGSENDELGNRLIGVGLVQGNTIWAEEDWFFKNNHPWLTEEDEAAGNRFGLESKNGKENQEKIKTVPDWEDDVYKAFLWAENYGEVATNLPENLSTGWYLPSLEEMNLIKDSTESNKMRRAIGAAIGENFANSYEQTDFYWTSTLNLWDSYTAKYVRFKDSGFYNKYNTSEMGVVAFHEF